MKCNESDDNLEKCTICLCEFEDDEDVRYIYAFINELLFIVSDL